MAVDTELRSIVNGIYDLQQLRISMGNRIVSSFRIKLGIKPSEDKKKRNKEADKLLKAIRKEYKRITDGIVKITTKFKIPEDTSLIASVAEIMLIKQYEDVLSCEETVFADMAAIVKTRPLWSAVFEHVKGVGPVVAGFLMAYVDIVKAETVSKLWYYVGYGVEKDGFATSRRKEHLIEVEYEDKEGKIQTKWVIHHNPTVRSKLAFVLSRGLITARDHYYLESYLPYKNRIQSMPKHKDKKAAHINNMAKRKAVKDFLRDIWPHWRELEGLPATPPYSEAKLGIKHGDHAKIAPSPKEPVNE
jgi:hypothetical protein